MIISVQLSASQQQQWSSIETCYFLIEIRIQIFVVVVCIFECAWRAFADVRAIIGTMNREHTQTNITRTQIISCALHCSSIWNSRLLFVSFLKLELLPMRTLATGKLASESVPHALFAPFTCRHFFFILLMRHCVIQYSVLLLVFFCISVCVASSWHTTLCCCYYVSKYSPEWRLNTQWSHTTHTQQKTTDNVMTSFHVIFGGFKITAFVVNVLCLNKHETAEFVQQASRMRMECACYNSSVKNVNFRHIMIVAGFRSVLDSATSANGFKPNIPM